MEGCLWVLVVVLLLLLLFLLLLLLLLLLVVVVLPGWRGKEGRVELCFAESQQGLSELVCLA